MTVGEALDVAEHLKPIPGWTQTRALEALQVLAEELGVLRGRQEPPPSQHVVSAESLADLRADALAIARDAVNTVPEVQPIADRIERLAMAHLACELDVALLAASQEKTDESERQVRRGILDRGRALEDGTKGQQGAVHGNRCGGVERRSDDPALPAGATPTGKYRDQLLSAAYEFAEIEHSGQDGSRAFVDVVDRILDEIDVQHESLAAGSEPAASHSFAASPAPSGWQPMETAPKDKRIMLLLTSGWISFGMWTNYYDGFLTESNNGCDSDAIGWMPVPAPPAGAESEKKP